MLIPEPRFYLKLPKATEPTLICLQVKFMGERVFLSTGDKIHPAEWDFTRQRAIVSKKSPGNSDINLWLDKIAADFKALFRNMQIDGGIPTAENMTKGLLEKMNKTVQAPKEEKVTLMGFIPQFITDSKALKAENTVKSYVSTFKHMEAYSGNALDFDGVTIEWRNGFIKYLQGLGVGKNTEGKHIKNIKVFMNDATERGLNNNLQFKSKSFSKPSEDVHKIFVTMDEIRRIAELEIVDDKMKSVVRDYFVISCLTSLRFSDFVNIKPENVKGNTLEMVTRKTGEPVIIPIAPMVRAILEKYDYQLPKAPCNQIFNRVLKDVGKLAEINEPVTITKTLGGQKKSKTFKKYELLTAHTGRRSMISNCILDGIPTPSIMLISAHKSLKVFQGYVRLNQVQNAEALSQHSFFNN